MVTARLVELPASMGPTLAVLGTLALVLGGAATVSGPVLAIKKADEVKKKTQRLFSEVKALQEIQVEQAAALAEHTSSGDPGSIAEFAEWGAESIERFRKSLQRCEQAARMLEVAIGEATPFASILERTLPGWNLAIPAVLPVLAQFRHEAQASHVVKDPQMFQAEAQQILLRSLAEQGLGKWGRALPEEDEPLFDEEDAQPIHWDSSRGWVEGAR